MRRTSIGLLLTLAALAAAIGWLGQVALTASGSPSIVPPITLTVALVVLAGVLIALGWPVRQAVRHRRRVDPFLATRVLLFAKAASPTGGLLTGAAVGLLLFALTRGVPPMPATVGAVIAALAAGVVLTAAGLLVEGWCRVPPDDRESAPPRSAVQR